MLGDLVDVRAEDWGRRIVRPLAPVTHTSVEFHHSVTDQYQPLEEAARTIQGWHINGVVNNTRYAAIWYNFLVSNIDGRLLEARGDGFRSQGTRATVCVLGNFQNATLSTPAKKTLSRVASSFGNRYNWHRQRRATACPGNNIVSYLEAGLPVQEPENTYGIGSSGQRVVMIQSVLHELAGFSSDFYRPDKDFPGVYGTSTRDAVNQLQLTLGITATGAWGPETQHAVNVYFDFLDSLRPDDDTCGAIDYDAFVACADPGELQAAIARQNA